MRCVRIAGPDGRKRPATIPQALAHSIVLFRSGAQSAAESIYREVLRYSPSAPEELHALGSACYAFGRDEEAAGYFRKAVARAPRHAAWQSDLGVALSRMGRFTEALDAFRLAVASDPENSSAYSNLGDLLTDMGRYEEALAHCRRAVELDPGSAEGHNNLGRVLEKIGRTTEARIAYARAVELDPNMALARGASEHREHALSAPSNHSNRNPEAAPELAEAHYNNALLLLRQGDFVNGFEEYEWRWRCCDFPSPCRDFAQPSWDGSDLSGRTILLHAEQGLGDTIQFVRFATEVARRNGRVVLEVQRPLLSLIERMAGDDHIVIAAGDPLPSFDVHCPLLSLPRALGTRLSTIPAPVAYLSASPERIAHFRALRTPGKTHVGLVWAGEASHIKDQIRSLPIECLAPLIKAGNAAFFSLQKGPAADQISRAPVAITDLAPELDDFSDTAAAIEALDLIITVDSAVAHLAGALGKPVWVLLPYSADWRWLLDRDDSPWYPSMRLFRQTEAGNWADVLSRVVDMLASMSPPPAASIETETSHNVSSREETDLARWGDPASLESGLNARSAFVAGFIPSGSTVLDLGCGTMALEKQLPTGCRYLPVDVVRRDERTTVCDFNNQDLPPAPDASIITLLGVLEHIHDWKAFLKRLRQYNLPVVLTYCVTDCTTALDQESLERVNHLGISELKRAFEESGFSLRTSARFDAHQMVFRLAPESPPTWIERKVLVLSYNNAGNFGDRLGVHMMHSLLPSAATVTYANFAPWNVPEGQFDHVVIGLGNSILLSDELLRLVERTPSSTGIFGTQHHDSTDSKRLGALLDRLNIWLARYEDDVLLYAKGRTNVFHLGDWLIGQFPLANWRRDERLVIDGGALADLPLDRTIEQIQQYREVFSERIHPLLCAFTSAERVAYREHREDASSDAESGKFRSLLIDVFGRTFPQETYFDVDRDAVRDYRARVLAVLHQMPGIFDRILGLAA